MILSRAFFLSIVVLSAAAAAPVNPSQPSGASTTPQPASSVSPQQNGLPASPIVQGLPGFNYQNQIISGTTFPAGSGPYATNQFGTAISNGDIGAALQNLQVAIAQNLPVLEAFNAGLSVSQGLTNSLGGTNTSFRAGGSGVMAQNASSLQTRSLAANNGANFSNLAATPTAPSIVTQTGGQTTVTPLGATGASAGNAGAPTGAGGVSSTVNIIGTTQLDAFRALIVLQADMERSLQILAAVNNNGIGVPNGGGFSGLSNNVATLQNQPPGSVTTTTTSPTPNVTTRSQTLTPTGR